MSRNWSKRSASFGMGALSMVAAIGLLAAPAAAQPAEGGLVLEEIIVTAQKRQQSLQDVPLSVSAVTGEKIESQGIVDMEKLSSYVPGVIIGKGAISTPINIRGIGSGNNRGFEQSVGMYIDGIYMGRDRQFRAPFLDLERVEVLRGPQGILFGKNTIAGAINITSATPTVGGEVEGRGSLRWEPGEGTYVATGILSVPLGEKAALRTATQYRRSDGYLRNVTTGQDEVGSEEIVSRLTLAFQPTEALTATLKYTYSNTDLSGMNTSITRFAPVTGTVTPPSTLARTVFANLPNLHPEFMKGGAWDVYRDDPARSGLATWTGREASLKTRSNLGVLDLDYEFENGVTLTSISGVSTYKTKDGIDIDFLPVPFIAREEDQDFKQYSQELRLTSPGGETIDYLVGAYAEKQDLTQRGTLFINSRLGVLPTSAFALQAASVYPLLPATVISRNSNFEQETDTLAVFGEATWNVGEDLRLTAGGRYARDKKDFLKQIWFGADASPQGIYAAPSSVLQENVLLLYIKTLDPNNNLVNTRGTLKETNFDPSFKLQYDVTDDVMAFATYSEGHKSGGFNGNDDQRLAVTANPWTALTPAGLSTRNPAYDPTRPGAGFSYRPESAKSIETGVKSKLMDGRMTLNVSAFRTKYSDLQVTLFEGASFIVSNADGATIKGIEMDTQMRLTESLNLSAGLAYLDFTFSDYANAGCTVQQISERAAPCTQDLTGRTNAYAPRWSGNLALDYLNEVGGGLQVRGLLDMNFKSAHYLDYDLDPATRQGAQARINLRIGLGDVDGKWEVTGYVENLTNRVTYTNYSDLALLPGAFVGLVQEPRIFGIEARYNF